MAEETSPQIVEQQEEAQHALPKFQSLLAEDELSDYLKDFPFAVDGMVKSDPGNSVLYTRFIDWAQSIIEFKPRKDDVWVLTFPKSGTTWTLEMVWMLLNNCNAEQAKKEQLSVRAPFLEGACIDSVSCAEAAEMMAPLTPTVEQIGQMESPRVIKSHLRFCLLPPSLLDTSKVVYVARNPKDVIVSYYYHHKLFPEHQNFTADIESFSEYFMKDQLLYSPYFPHVLDAWSKKENPNFLFLFYEDMKKDLKGEIQKVADFIGKTISEEQRDLLAEHLSFEKLSQNDTVNMECFRSCPGILNPNERFLRKGKTGDWKNHFNPEINKRIDDWMAENLKESDLKFVTELEIEETQ